MALAESLPNIPYRESTPGTTFTTDLPEKIRPVAPEADTLSKNFMLRVDELADQTAQRKKRYGIWREYTWREVYEHAVNFGMGLLQLGLRQSDTLLIIGETIRKCTGRRSPRTPCIARPAAFSAMPVHKISST